MVSPQDFIHRLKSQNYILNKQYTCKSTAEEVSFEWSHHRISKVRIYILNKQYHVKVLLKRFRFNGHTISLPRKRSQGFVTRSHAFVGEERLRDEPVRTSAWEATHHRISSKQAQKLELRTPGGGGGGGGSQQRFILPEASALFSNPRLFINYFRQKNYSFRIPYIDKCYPFHTH